MKRRKTAADIIAVGTTSTRTLESVTDENGVIQPKKRLDEDFHLSRIHLQGGGLPCDKFPSAGIYTDHAGICTGGKRACHGSL